MVNTASIWSTTGMAIKTNSQLQLWNLVRMRAYKSHTHTHTHSRTHSIAGFDMNQLINGQLINSSCLQIQWNQIECLQNGVTCPWGFQMVAFWSFWITYSSRPLSLCFSPSLPLSSMKWTNSCKSIGWLFANIRNDILWSLCANTGFMCANRAITRLTEVNWITTLSYSTWEYYTKRKS